MATFLNRMLAVTSFERPWCCTSTTVSRRNLRRFLGFHRRGSIVTVDAGLLDLEEAEALAEDLRTAAFKARYG